MSLLYFQIYKRGFYHAENVAFFKHITHYGPRSGFLYYSMTNSPSRGFLLSSTQGRAEQLYWFEPWESSSTQYFNKGLLIVTYFSIYLKINIKWHIIITIFWENIIFVFYLVGLCGHCTDVMLRMSQSYRLNPISLYLMVKVFILLYHINKQTNIVLAIY